MAGINGDSEISNKAVGGLSATVRYKCIIIVLVGKINCFEGLSHSSDLVQFNQNGIGNAFGNTFSQYLFICAKNIVTYNFNLPAVLKSKRKEVIIVGIIGFLMPFLGATAVAKYLLHWEMRASLLAGIALSTTSMAVVYSVMLEYGFNKTEFGKGILGACFVNDLGTVIALGLIFAPFTFKTIIFITVCIVAFFFLPYITRRLMHLYAFKTAAIRTKWILFILFSLGALALWAGSEAVLPAYIVGMVLATTINKDDHFIRRFRTLTIGFLTPFYFLRAGALVSVPAIVTAPVLILILFGSKILSKIFGLFPVISRFRSDCKERWYYTLLMSTGLTFGTISALYGLTHGIVSKEQYSCLVAVVIGSALIPTIIANFAFLPKHLLNIPVSDEEMIQLDKDFKEQDSMDNTIN